ncbi:MAG: sensor histidine kinase, partial [Methanosarcinaceae archaeon]|nr:sensor histidine kinase [Methanosarcinaceae archaeon]
ALAKNEEIRKREIHHRIKNNLQVVSSLLSLQSEKFEDEKVVAAFRESEQRVISMALIHEELYRSEDAESIDFSAYLKKLAADLLRSYKVGYEEIRLLLDVEDISLGIDTAVPLGIIVNELFSNSLKYAFPEGVNGEIYVGLRKRKAEEYENTGEKESFTLTFSDNGIGLPEKPDPGENGDKGEGENGEGDGEGSLGLKLINALVVQLEGCIEIERDGGTKYIIRFKDVG